MPIYTIANAAGAPLMVTQPEVASCVQVGMSSKRYVTVAERPEIPALSVFLGFGAMLPLAAGAVASWALRRNQRRMMRDATLLWGGSILVFLAGVRRGLSFRTPGGARIRQVGTSLSLFGLGLGSLLALRGETAPVLQGIGYAAIATLDPRAAERKEAPLFFEQLRPVQMVIPVVSLIVLALLPGDGDSA